MGMRSQVLHNLQAELNIGDHTESIAPTLAVSPELFPSVLYFCLGFLFVGAKLVPATLVL